SDTSDPTGTWTQFAMRADFVYLADYPKAGIWHDAIYISANMFSFPNGPFQGAKVWALNKADLYSGTLNAQSVSSTNYYAWSLLPSNAKGPTLPSATTPNYMITMDANEYGPPSTDKLVYWEYDVNWTTPGLTSFTGPTFLPTAAFGLTASGIPQPGTGWQLDSLFGRLMFPAIYREFDGHAAMYVNHVAESGGKRVERWYELRFSGGTPSIYQQGTYAPDSIHRWMGSIAADEDGNIAIGYTASSSALFPSVRYSAQASIAAVSGVLGLGEKSIKDGTGSQIGISRWGDYSAISIDPTDDETFWYTNEYYISSGSNWQTRIGAFKIKPDLWSQDRPDDVGDEPNTTSSHFWQSQDIWIRNQNDGFTVQVHQNPEYGQTNYFYVKIRNRDSEGSGIDKVYWAYPGTGLSWPASWNFIGQQPTGTLTQGSTTILEFPWSPPDPGAYATPHFCLLSRIETSPIPPYGMTFPEVSSINTNVRNNNNIVWKNITIVDNVPPGPSGGGGGTTIIAVNNLKKRAVTTRIEFVAVEQADTALTARRAGVMTTTASTKKNVLDWGKVEVDLGTTLFSRWNTKSRKGTGVTADAERATYIKIDEDKAHIEDIELKAGEEFLIRFNFLPFEDSADDKTEYVFDVIQYDFNGKEYEEIGGVRLVLRPPKEDTKTDAKK
ncbi:MAG: hypothetical protein GY940_31915, partial [bacterium]|nr:hypothetical protein [bacterium]